MATQIRFGTSGWRAVMAEDFIFVNVRRAVTGIARYAKSQRSEGVRVIVGRDPRFLGETFCSMASDLLANYGVTPLVIAEPAPTPAISYAVIHEKSRRSHQLHRLAQSARIQRHQVFHPQRRPRPARSDKAD